MLLALAEQQPACKMSDDEIRRHYRVRQRSIERTRQRFIEDGLEIAVSGKKRARFKDKQFAGRMEAE